MKWQLVNKTVIINSTSYTPYCNIDINDLGYQWFPSDGDWPAGWTARRRIVTPNSYYTVGDSQALEAWIHDISHLNKHN